MKNLKTLSLTLALCLCIVLSLIPTAQAAETLSSPVKTGNIGDYEYTYDRWANPIKSYLVPNADGTFTRVEYTCKAVTVETYNSSLTFVSGFTIDMELPIFGGFYSGTDRNFLVFGQLNTAESDDTEVVRVVSYTKDWQRIASASLCGANTYIPFDAGCLRFAEYGGYLYIRTAHEMYMSSDGLHHQSNLTLNVRISDMVITDSYYNVMNSSYGYVSHSFNQFIVIDGTDIITVDHGDAHPRSVVLMKYNAPAGQDSFMQSQRVPVDNGYYTYAYVKTLDVLPISGSTGANDTGVALGGFEISDSAYLIAGNTVEHGDNYDAFGQRNIFVSATTKGDLTTAQTTMNYLTAYTGDDNVTLSNPHFTKVADNKYIVMWTESGSETECLRYAFVDGSGKLIGSVYTAKGVLSDCQPIVSGGKVIWYVTNASGPAFFTIDLNSPETITHDHVYTYSYARYPSYTGEGRLTGACTICGEAGESVVIPAIQNSDAYTLYSTTTAPTCTEDGTGRYQWKDATFYGATNYIYTAIIPATGHSYTDGVCGNCGAADPDYVEPVNGTITLKGTTLSLEDEILYNLYFTTSDMDVAPENMGMLVFDSQPANISVSTADQKTDGAIISSNMYMVSTEGISGKNLGDTKYLVAYAKLDNGSYVYSSVLPYSAKSYCFDRLEKSSNANLKALCVAILNYGAAAQEYFAATSDYTYTTLMNADLTADQKALVKAYSADMVAARGTVTADKTGIFGTTSTATGFSGRGASMSADGIFSINYYFTTSTAVDNVTMYYWNAADFANASTLTKANATGSKAMTATGKTNQFWADVRGIAAKDLDKTIYVCGVYEVDGVTYSTGVFAYSLGYYCVTMAQSGSAVMKPMAAATAVYGYYAKTYFGA